MLVIFGALYTFGMVRL